MASGNPQDAGPSQPGHHYQKITVSSDARAHLGDNNNSNSNNNNNNKYIFVPHDWGHQLQSKRSAYEQSSHSSKKAKFVHESEKEEDSTQELLARFDFNERLDRERQIGNTRVRSSTFEWIWSIPDGDSSFRQWTKDSRAVFWIQGKPGSGKSVLMDYLSTSGHFLQHPSTSPQLESKCIRFFFDFRADQGIANNYEGLLRSLLLQIHQQVPSVELELHYFKNKAYISRNVSEWNTRDLEEIFDKVIENLSINLYIFVDGLDEYSGDIHDLVAFLVGLPEKSGVGGRLKVCLASRPEPGIFLALRTCPGFRMQDWNLEGITKYVSSRIDGLVVDETERKNLRRLCVYLPRQAEGVYLWARFAVNEAITLNDKGKEFNEIERRLSELPNNMEELYDHIFSRMSARDRDEARLMFQLVCFAGPDAPYDLHRCQVSAPGHENHNNFYYLTVLQLKEAMAIARNKPADLMKEKEVASLDRFMREMKDISGGLLEEIWNLKREESQEEEGEEEEGYKEMGDEVEDIYCDEDNNVERISGCPVKLIHRTVKSYLDRKGWLSQYHTKKPFRSYGDHPNYDYSSRN